VRPGLPAVAQRERSVVLKDRAGKPLRPELVEASDSSLLISFDATLGVDGRRAVGALVALLDGHPFDGFVDLSPAALSVLVRFDPVRQDHDGVAAHVTALLQRLQEAPVRTPRRITIPVEYGGAAGPDLEEVARRTGLTPEEVIARHAAGTYEVLFLGFSPGFAYLGGLDRALHCPRLESPRPAVPAGSVGIAGGQTAVYPSATPGGWRLIGRTSLKLFDPGGRPMTLLERGDEVHFEPRT
jgi:KipI family sensor histidine kinase inhibitor